MGNSTLSALEKYDMVFFDHSRPTVIGKSSIFAFRTGERLVVKRVGVSLEERSVFLRRDSPIVPKNHITSSVIPEFEILGKIVWSVHAWPHERD